MHRRLLRHKLGIVGAACLLVIVLSSIFAGFVAPYGPNEMSRNVNEPPQLPRFVDSEGHWYLRPFVYGLQPKFDMSTGKVKWVTDTSEKYFIHIFVEGPDYKILGMSAKLHLFGTKGYRWMPLGSDRLGRDMLSRIIYGGRVSLAIGLLTTAISIFLGAMIGMISGYLGGMADLVVQRVVELFLIIPSVPLGLTLAAFLSHDIPDSLVVIGVAFVLTITKWAFVARQVRGETLSVREESYVAAARAIGASDLHIMVRHILRVITPNLVVMATLIMPQAILLAAALSFLGFGVRSPMVSWGLLLREARQLRVIGLYPWQLLPGAAILIACLSINVIGDAFRDVLSPYGRNE